MATIIADTHVHLYPCYNLSQALDSARHNLKVQSHTLSHPVSRALFLTERFDCDFFRSLASGRGVPASLTVTKGPTAETIILADDKNQEITLVAGRQFISKERVEVLALGTTMMLQDFTFTAKELLQKTLENGAVPVLCWSPGKWFGARGNVVKSIIKESEPTKFFLGDIAIRPAIWSTPALMKLARKKGFRCLAGSDPLPFPGEEKLIGSYATVLSASSASPDPMTALKSTLSNTEIVPEIVGKRSTATSMLRRLWCNKRARRLTKSCSH